MKIDNFDDVLVVNELPGYFQIIKLTETGISYETVVASKDSRAIINKKLYADPDNKYRWININLLGLLEIKNIKYEENRNDYFSIECCYNNAPFILSVDKYFLEELLKSNNDFKINVVFGFFKSCPPIFHIINNLTDDDKLYLKLKGLNL